MLIMEVLLWQREDSGVVAKSGDVYKHGDYGGNALAEVAITEVLLYVNLTSLFEKNEKFCYKNFWFR